MQKNWIDYLIIKPGDSENYRLKINRYQTMGKKLSNYR
jgi:hypothetical protein